MSCFNCTTILRKLISYQFIVSFSSLRYHTGRRWGACLWAKPVSSILFIIKLIRDSHHGQRWPNSAFAGDFSDWCDSRPRVHTLTLHHPPASDHHPEPRTKAVILRKRESASPFQGPALPIFSGEAQAVSGPQQGSLRCCTRERLHHTFVNAGHSRRFREASDSQKVRRLSGSKKLRTFPFSLCKERHRSARKRWRLPTSRIISS